MWAIVDDTKLYRLTFSKSLAEMISKQSNGKYRMKRYDCILGRPLSETEVSRTGIYAVVSTSKGIVLRAPMFKEMAEMYRDPSRSIYEAFLEPV